MTTLVGLIDLQGSVIIGMDSRQTAGRAIKTDKKRKWFAPLPGIIVATCGMDSTIQLMQHELKWNGLTACAPEELEDFGVQRIAPQIRRIMRKHKISRDQEGFVLLAGCAAGLLIVDSDGTVGSITDKGDYCGAGTGGAYAAGALAVTSLKNGQRAVRRALKAAIKHDSASGGDIKIAVVK